MVESLGPVTVLYCYKSTHDRIKLGFIAPNGDFKIISRQLNAVFLLENFILRAHDAWESAENLQRVLITFKT